MLAEDDCISHFLASPGKLSSRGSHMHISRLWNKVGPPFHHTSLQFAITSERLHCGEASVRFLRVRLILKPGPPAKVSNYLWSCLKIISIARRLYQVAFREKSVIKCLELINHHSSYRSYWKRKGIIGGFSPQRNYDLNLKFRKEYFSFLWNEIYCLPIFFILLHLCSSLWHIPSPKVTRYLRSSSSLASRE